MYVISASRRTDIPAFYSRWFMNRVRAGFCHWLNPFSNAVYRTALAPEDVIAFVFWTRNPRPLMAHLAELNARGYKYYFGVSLLGYGRPLETHNPSLEEAIGTFQDLALQTDPRYVVWRYDPIVISSRTPPQYHVERFAHIARRLEGCTTRCIYSFVDFYGKTRRNLAQVTATEGVTFTTLSTDQRYRLLSDLAEIAAAHGITLQSCCEDDARHVAGVQTGSCVDLGLLRDLTGDRELMIKAQPTREFCGCVKSVDIGSYDTCLFGCRYCYATNQRSTARRNFGAHDPNDTILYRPPQLAGVDLDDQIYRAFAAAETES
jgi:hypothetical protein